MEFLKLDPEALGLDISDLSLKFANLKKKKDFLDLASFGEIELEEGIVKEGEIKKEDKLVEMIKNLLKTAKGEKIKTKYVVASLPEEKAFLQVIQLPKMEEEEVKKAVYFEAENYIPLPLESVYLDCQIVPPLYDHLDHLDVSIAAVPKKIVDSYVRVLKKAGLEPKALEIESQAISRALIKKEVALKPLLLIDLGATRTSFIIFSGYALRFTVSISVSSSGFTHLISHKLKIDLKKAEEMKRKYGIRKQTKEGEKLHNILFPHLMKLVQHIKRYIRYYQTHITHEHLLPGSRRIEEILLCGGGALLKGLPEFLTVHLNLPVKLGNPWVNILPQPLKEVPLLSYSHSLKYTTALGLALRGIKNYDKFTPSSI